MALEVCPVCSNTNEDDEHCLDAWHFRDWCLVCGKEIPPGPDFCSIECEAKSKRK